MLYFAGLWLQPTTGFVTNNSVSLAKTPHFGVFFYGKNKVVCDLNRKYLHGQHTNHNRRSRYDQKHH